MNDFERNLSLINELVTVCECMSDAGRVNTTIAELTERLHRSLNEIVRLFEVLGIQPGSWSEPQLYRLADIIEAGTGHEVSQRM